LRLGKTEIANADQVGSESFARESGRGVEFDHAPNLD
jgi:hypothetical protein